MIKTSCPCALEAPEANEQGRVPQFADIEELVLQGLNGGTNRGVGLNSHHGVGLANAQGSQPTGKGLCKY